MSVKLEESWLHLLADQFEQPYFKQIKEKLLQEKAEHHVVYPPGSQIFAALDFCPADKVKAVIIGQDPYHNPGQAHGLCFSVPMGIQPPPSLINIFQELHDD
ncbi:MAG: uracil-DNA glycosylase, partial [Fibrobacter sp.]|nr:uracil-DNA glycosylase [Fibrobacter sp.]